MSTDFIAVTPGALSADLCRRYIERFEAGGQAGRGVTGGGLDLALKDSWDIGLDGRPEWKDVVDRLNAVMMGGLIRYVRLYPHVIAAPFALRVEADGRMLDAETIRALSDADLRPLLARLLRPGRINIQKYVADQGGYPHWHAELYPKAGDATGETLHRVLLWSIYLNDGFEEGETEFLHQERRITPGVGDLLIAPAGFTHTHRGNRPKGGDKYIATSWVLFKRAETIFG